MAASSENSMKKYLKRKNKSTPEDTVPARITNETVAEHREKVLAGGRKYKYPRQYQKHRLVIVSMGVVVAAIVLLAVVAWQQLYVAQNSSGLLYRVMRIVPLSVASVDGEPVRYADYLMRYRSSIFYYRQYNAFNENTADGKRQAEYTKRQEMTNSERFAYARKLAKQHKVSVTDKDVDDFINADISLQGVSLQAYERTVLRSYYDWSLSEYKQVVRDRLLLKEVSFAIDKAAEKRIGDIHKRAVAEGADFAAIAKESSEDAEGLKANGGDVGVVPRSSADADGLIKLAASLEPGQVSDPVRGTDAHYVVKLIAKTEETVHFQRIRVELTEFDKSFQKLQDDGKIKEFIHIEKTEIQRRQ